jgi:hypothetical protein
MHRLRITETRKKAAMMDDGGFQELPRTATISEYGHAELTYRRLLCRERKCTSWYELEVSRMQ